MPRRKVTLEGGEEWDPDAFRDLLAKWFARHPDAQISDFASAAKISSTQVHRLKQPAVDPGISLALRVAKTLGTSIMNLTRET